MNRDYGSFDLVRMPDNLSNSAALASASARKARALSLALDRYSAFMFAATRATNERDRRTLTADARASLHMYPTILERF